MSTVNEIQHGRTCFGLPLSWVRFGASHVERDVSLNCAALAFCLRGEGRRRVDVGHQQLDLGLAPGMFSVGEGGLLIKQGCYEGVPGEAIRIQFPAHALNEMVQDDQPKFELRTQHEAFDDRVGWLIKSIWALQSGPPADALYEEGLVLSLVGLLRQGFGQAVRSTKKVPGVFDWQMRKRLEDFIEHGLGGRLSVQHLAREVNMSPQHFARVFAKTFGQPPHHYVMSRRIAGARRTLVNDPQRTVSEIAMSFGFANPAHFSKCFKDAVGAAPATWRQED